MTAYRLMLLAVFVATAALVLWWGRIPGRWRRLVSLAASGAGLAFLVVALQTAGHREATTTGSFLLRGRYVAEQASASASLPYYVMTAVCLLLGTAGLAVPDPTARRLSEHGIRTAVVLSILITALRFALEKAVAPTAWTWAVGVTWLAPLVGAFFAVQLRRLGRRGLPALAGALLVYGLVSRAWVALAYLGATALQLGSHYDLSAAWIQVEDPLPGAVRSLTPGSFTQMVYVVLLPQLLFWPLYTVLAGLLGAALAYVVAGARGWAGRARLPMGAASPSQR